MQTKSFIRNYIDVKKAIIKTSSVKITLKQYGILHVPLLTSNHSYRCQHFGTIVTKILLM